MSVIFLDAVLSVTFQRHCDITGLIQMMPIFSSYADDIIVISPGPAWQRQLSTPLSL